VCVVPLIVAATLPFSLLVLVLPLNGFSQVVHDGLGAIDVLHLHQPVTVARRVRRGADGLGLGLPWPKLWSRLVCVRKRYMRDA
jgi:hypothetical protein